MSKKKSPHGRKRKTNDVSNKSVEDADMKKFAGSSDEEEDSVAHEEVTSKTRVIVEHDADDEGSENDEDGSIVDGEEGGPDQQPFVLNEGSALEEAADPGQKMAGVMAKILGTQTSASTKPSSVILAKTTTPLQRLQQKEKEKIKALKMKRKANRERNLAALHIPLLVATSNVVGEGKSSITKELEQERFHRRVATRGVVALFNAISQHQNATEEDNATTSKTPNKLTKHGFLDKIKSTAAAVDSKEKNAKISEEKSTGKWDALKEDFMMKPKKNWDEESSEEENSGDEPPEDFDVDEMAVNTDNKRRKTRA